MLEPPYGSCSQTAEDASICHSRCKAEVVLKDCGCVEIASVQLITGRGIRLSKI